VRLLRLLRKRSEKIAIFEKLEKSQKVFCEMYRLRKRGVEMFLLIYYSPP
jgi:hypothetical protein